MRVHYLLLLAIVSVFLFTVGCSNTEDKTTKDHSEEADAAAEDENSDDKQENDKNDQDTNDGDYRSDLGNLQIWIGGVVTVAEDKGIVEGESNLLPGAKISSSGVSDNWASTDYQDQAEVEDDGSFYFEFPGRESDIDVTLSLATANEQVTDHYGEHLEKATGNQVYQTSDEGEFSAQYTFDIDTRKAMPYTIDLETPDWSDVPDDYGDSDIWMEVDATTKHNYLYFEGKSNLVEGSYISGNITDPEDLPSSAWSSSNTRVNPDGSFQLQIHYWDLREGMQMHFEFDPDNNNDWDHVLDMTVEKGEKLEGNLVEEKDKGDQNIKLSIEFTRPEINALKDVDLNMEEEKIKMQVPDDLLFDFDESKLKSEAKETLDEIINDLSDLGSEVDIQINGHTDNEGDADYNITLSEERAEAVAEYFSENSDLDSSMMSIEGLGDTEPIASNKNEDERQKNRRVEIVINPK